MNPARDASKPVSAPWSKILHRAGPVELASCSFGQSSKVSYLQMITAVAAIVNGGRLMEPYVVAEARDSDGVLLWEKEPTVKRQVISEETSETMCLLMENVVATGTGQNASVAGYRVGGKSGTSQKLDSEDASARIASFVAVAPVEEPRLAVLVCLDEPHSWTTSGGSLSAPVCAEVLAKALPYLGIEPQYTEEEQQKLFAEVPDVTGWRTEAASLKLQEYGLTAHIDGDAERVVAQYPLPGVQVRKNSVVFLDTTGENDPTLEE